MCRPRPCRMWPWIVLKDDRRRSSCSIPPTKKKKKKTNDNFSFTHYWFRMLYVHSCICRVQQNRFLVDPVPPARNDADKYPACSNKAMVGGSVCICETRHATDVSICIATQIRLFLFPDDTVKVYCYSITLFVRKWKRTYCKAEVVTRITVVKNQTVKQWFFGPPIFQLEWRISL